MTEDKPAMQMVEEARPDSKVVAVRIPKLSRAMRRKMRWTARRTIKRIAQMPRERALKTLSSDDLEYWQREHSVKLEVEYREVDE